MGDKYWAMTELYATETEGDTYTKEWYRHRWRYKTEDENKKENEVFIMAPHGGSIETGTTELALATAGFTDDFTPDPDVSPKYDYFVFNGNNPAGTNDLLHVTSKHYDEPVATELVRNSVISLAFHGCTDKQAKPNLPNGAEYKACLIGGLDEPFKKILNRELKAANFPAKIATIKDLNGDHPENIINKNKRLAGAQFELTTSFRESLFDEDATLATRKTKTKPEFWHFVNTVRKCIKLYREDLKV